MYICNYMYGIFHKWGYPKWLVYFMENPIKIPFPHSHPFPAFSTSKITYVANRGLSPERIATCMAWTKRLRSA